MLKSCKIFIALELLVELRRKFLVLGLLLSSEEEDSCARLTTL